MSSAKKVLYTIAASVAVGALIGMLYAPDKGAETRRRINKLKRKFTCCSEDGLDDDRETLEELSHNLKQELDRINKKLESK